MGWTYNIAVLHDVVVRDYWHSNFALWSIARISFCFDYLHGNFYCFSCDPFPSKKFSDVRGLLEL